MNSSRRKLLSVVMLLSIFGSGAIAGVAIDRAWLRPTSARGSRVDRLVERFGRRLQLDDRQRLAVRAALLKSRAATAATRRRIEPELRAARQAARKEIAATLTVEQQKKYRVLIERYEARRARRKGGR